MMDDEQQQYLQYLVGLRNCNMQLAKLETETAPQNYIHTYMIHI